MKSRLFTFVVLLSLLLAACTLAAPPAPTAAPTALPARVTLTLAAGAAVHSVLTGEAQAAPALQKLEQDLKNLLGK
ncbi:MAG: hypothetical protein OHK0052_05580 [Anaerolineales bacterium]